MVIYKIENQEKHQQIYGCLVSTHLKNSQMGKSPPKKKGWNKNTTMPIYTYIYINTNI